MQEDGLKARVRKRYKVTTDSDHDQPIADNRPGAAVHGRAPRISAGSATPREFVIGESGKLYLAVILDLVLSVRRRLGGQCRQRSTPDDQGARDGVETALSRSRSAASLRPGLHVRQRGLSTPPRDSRHHLQHEPPRQLLRQRGHGSVLLDGQERARRTVRQPRRREDGSCSTTSRCSITSGAGTRRSVGSVRPRSSDERPRRDDDRLWKCHGCGNHKSISTAVWKSRTPREISTFPQAASSCRDGKERRATERSQPVHRIGSSPG